jgi:hypothetical protein
MRTGRKKAMNSPDMLSPHTKELMKYGAAVKAGGIIP